MNRRSSFASSIMATPSRFRTHRCCLSSKWWCFLNSRIFLNASFLCFRPNRRCFSARVTRYAIRPKAISQPRVIAICSTKVSLVRQSQIVTPHRASFRAARTAQFRRVGQVAKYQDKLRDQILLAVPARPHFSHCWRSPTRRLNEVADVRFWHKADMGLCAANVRYWG